MFVYAKLVGKVCSVLRKMYCTCFNRHKGDYHGLPIPHNYRLLETFMQDTVWINKALNATGILKDGNVVTNVEIIPFGPSSGFYSELANLKITYKNDSESCIHDVIVKFLPHGLEKRIVMDLVLFQKFEVICYNFLLREPEKYGMAKFPVKVPRPLYVDFCTKTNSNVLMLEKITDTLGDQRLKTPSVEQGRAMMVAIAQTHAYFWPSNGVYPHPETCRLNVASSPVFKIVAVKLRMLFRGAVKLVKGEF